MILGRLYALWSRPGIVASLAGILIWGLSAGPGPPGEDSPTGQVARADLGGPIWSVAYSTDGAYLASATITGDVWLGELPTGRVVRLASGPWSSAQSLAFAPSGHVLAVAGFHTEIRLWDVDAVDTSRTFAVPRGFSKCVAFSTDGALLAVSEIGGDGENGMVSLWDFRKACRLAALEGHRSVINALAFSADGSRLASGDSQGDLRIWDVATHRVRASLRGNERGGSLLASAFSTDGTLLATSALSDRVVRLWDAADGSPRGTLPASMKGAYALAFSPLAPTLAMARGDGVVALWDIVGRRELGVLTTGGPTLQSVAFSPDGHRLATGGTDGVLRVWDLARVIREIPSAGPPDVAP